MHDPTDDPAIVYPLDTTHIPRQIRRNSSPLLVAQPKQILPHDPDPLPKTNQDRILRAEKLMSSDPSKRLGHVKPDITLRIYAHLFREDDGKAAAAISALKFIL